ncbi:MAG: PqqD family peptide modification chaperone [Clostridia bacterium]|nr:PqqD family peptide modification chaperone [Oscillospiraceae bacterium]MBQ7032627.1 PqqD family peptide modification chaperone [Clostridia bacterium]
MKQSVNYLDKVPARNEKFKWSQNDAGIVTIEVPNRGVFHFLAQKLLKKPPVTYVHLDKTGSFVWPILDGKMDVHLLGQKVEAQFGEAAHPLYERLVKFFQILESYGFIVWNR